MFKICTKCKMYKSFTEFPKNIKLKSGVDSNCKQCRYIAGALNRDKKTKEIKVVSEYKFCTMCKVEKRISCYSRDKYSKDGFTYRCKQCKQESDKVYVSSNKQKRLQNYLRFEKDKLKNDVNFKLKKTLRNRIRDVLKKGYKSGSAVSDLGCSVNELKVYLESRFKEGMTWENHGEWHIDHIVPLAFFDLTDREQFLKACHYTNLQPLWAKENLQKRDKHACK